MLYMGAPRPPDRTAAHPPTDRPSYHSLDPCPSSKPPPSRRVLFRIYMPPLCAQSCLSPHPNGHDASLPLCRCLQSGKSLSSSSPVSFSPVPHSSPTMSSTSANPQLPSRSWQQYSQSRRFGPSSSFPTLPHRFRPFSSPSPHTLVSSLPPSPLTVSPLFTLSRRSLAPPSASSQSGGAYGKRTRAGITYVFTNCTRSMVPSSESVRTSCLLRMSVRFPRF
jgi:hypothetical protein